MSSILQMLALDCLLTIRPRLWVMIAPVCILLSGCFPATPDIVKVGVVAPFDGQYREIGYDVIPAIRLATREWAIYAPRQNIRIEIVAYDDLGDPALATQQAIKLVSDPAVALVIGHWREETTQATDSVYEEAGVPLITFSLGDIPTCSLVFNLAPSQEDFDTLARSYAAEIGAIYLPSREDPNTDAEEVHDALSRGTVIVGGPGFGLSVFRNLAGDIVEGIPFVSPYPITSFEALLASSGYWSSERLDLFQRGFSEGSLGATPGYYSGVGYQAGWLAITIMLNQAETDLPSNPASDLEFGTCGRRIDAPLYVYVWDNRQIRLLKILTQ